MTSDGSDRIVELVAENPALDAEDLVEPMSLPGMGGLGGRQSASCDSSLIDFKSGGGEPFDVFVRKAFQDDGKLMIATTIGIYIIPDAS